MGSGCIHRISQEWRDLDKRKVGIALRVVIALLLVLALITWPIGKGQGVPKLSGALQRLLELRALGLSAAQAYATTQGVQISGDEERLTVVVEAARDIADLLRVHGGQLLAKYKGLWQVNLPLRNLPLLASAAPVSYIRLPQAAIISEFRVEARSLIQSTSGSAGEASGGPIVSEGVALLHADAYHQQGIRGQGVRVGIIDLGFAELDRIIQQGELPQNVVAWNCLGSTTLQTEPPCCRQVSPAELSAASRGEVHGTAVAEIVHDMAPDAELHLFLISTEVELGQAVTQAIDRGVRVINHSIVWFNDGSFYDGRGFIGDIAHTARQNGIFWVNAAGNFAQSHYEGAFYDTNNDQFHDEDIELEIAPGEGFDALLTWDAWPRTNEDFDLFLERGQRQEASSINRQNGTEPSERIIFTSLEGGRYRLRIKWVGEGAPPQDRRMELFINPPEIRVSPRVAESSLPEPANSDTAFAVGAVRASYWEEGRLEPFSSQGPTNDGRLKPDLVAPDCVRTLTYEGLPTEEICGMAGEFPGTSAAAPHVAGMATLLLSENPERSVTDLEGLLKERARPVLGGNPNWFGAGLADLITVHPGPDLVVTEAHAEPAAVNPGEQVTIHARIRNSGDVGVGPFWVALWREREEGLTKVELATQRVRDGLGAGAECEIALRWSVPEEEPIGELWVVVVVDPYGDVREGDETNNRYKVPIQVQRRVLDKKPPVIRGIPSPEPNVHGWNNGDVTITLTAEDEQGGSGIAAIYYELSGQQVEIGASRLQLSEGGRVATYELIFSAEGVHQLEFWAEDNAGNESQHDTLTVKIDKVPPLVRILLDPSSPDGREGWYTQPVKVKYECSDTRSGLDPRTPCPPETTLTDDGTHELTVTVKDQAGNSASDAKTVKLDRTPPQINCQPPDATRWYREDVSVPCTARDTTSGLANPADANFTLVAHGEGRAVLTETRTVADRAGNTATAGPFTCQIDKTPPEIQGNRSPGPNSYGWNNTDVTVRFSCSDALSGIASCTPEQTISREGSGQSVTGEAIDKAGNHASMTVSDINIDKTKPSITISPNSGSFTGSVSGGWRATDSLSGLESCEVRINSNFYSNSCEGSFALDSGEHRVDVSARDRAENSNSDYRTYTVRISPLPDLILKSLVASEFAERECCRVTFHARIENQGDAPAGSFEVSFLLDGKEFYSGKVAGLAAGEQVSVLTGGIGFKKGQYTLTINIDAKGSVSESNEQNNKSDWTLEVQIGERELDEECFNSCVDRCNEEWYECEGRCWWESETQEEYEQCVKRCDEEWEVCVKSCKDECTIPPCTILLRPKER
jgi:subtilisin family serine protease